MCSTKSQGAAKARSERLSDSSQTSTQEGGGGQTGGKISRYLGGGLFDIKRQLLWIVFLFPLIQIKMSNIIPTRIQLTTSGRRQDGGAHCGAAVGGKCMVSQVKLVIYEFAIGMVGLRLRRNLGTAEKEHPSPPSSLSDSRRGTGALHQ